MSIYFSIPLQIYVISCSFYEKIQFHTSVKENSIDIYPNPAKNMIIISSKENLRSYKIYDEAGRLVISASLLKGNKIEVNLSTIQSGNYLISIETEKQTFSKKLIKQ